LLSKIRQKKPNQKFTTYKESELSVEDWKKLVKTKPPKLNPTLKRIIEQMYKAASNELAKRKMFAVRRLTDIAEECKKLNVLACGY
jgi:hypothetical protein